MPIRPATGVAQPAIDPPAADPPVPAAVPPAPPAGAIQAPVGRLRAIDLARGLAVALMILSHGVNGLLDFDQFTDWGRVPVHALTKLASSLFIVVFGIAMAVIYLPRVRTPQWPSRRNRMLWRGLVVLFWYKLLTVVELHDTRDPQAIIDTLLFRDFPSYVEILGFYAIALLWLPWFLPLWARMPASLRWASPVLVGLAAWWLLEHFGFWGVPQLQAVLVEHPAYYTWGQLARAPLVLLGLLIGGLMLRWQGRPRTRLLLAGGVAAAAAVSLAGFLAVVDGPLRPALDAIARNVGKHPPQLEFMLFSVGGALALLALALAGGEALARWLRPITVVGSDALTAFVFHIAVIFLLLRGPLGYLHSVDYRFALLTSVALVLATSAWIAWLQWLKRRWLRRTGRPA